MEVNNIDIAGYKLYSIVTSNFKLDGGAMFGIIPKTLWNTKMPADDLNRIEMVTRSLLLVNENKRILIDTGNGDKWQDKFKKIYEIDTEKVNIVSSLQKFGFSPDDITDVICSHMHFDHIGGNTKFDNDKIVPTFSNATYWVHEENWKLANSPSEKDQGSFMQDDWAVLVENSMLKIVKGNNQFLSNIDFLMSNGHTTGMMLPYISDENNTLVYCADLIPTSSHISLPWVMSYDIHPTLTIKEKKHLYNKAVKDNWILFFEHDPYITSSTVDFDGKHYKIKDSIII